MYVYLAVAILSAAMAGSGAWKVQSWRFAAKQAEAQELQREKDRADRKSIDVAAVGHEKDKAQIRTEFLTITKEVERVVEKPLYRNTCFDADGLRELAGAIGAANAASQPASTVSRPPVAR